MERLVVHLANGLSSKDISVLVICLQGKGQLATELQEPGIEIQELESYSGKDLTTTPRSLSENAILSKLCVITKK